MAAAVAMLLPQAASASLSPSQIVAKLNQERAALGIPAVKLNRSRAKACRAHDSYMRRNRQLTHFEVRGRPGYSAAGDRAAKMSVLAGPRAGWNLHNPWRNAPIHLAQVLNPGLRATGAFDSHGYSCLYTYPVSRPRSPADKIWTLPADGGRVVRAQTAFEAPYPPQQTVGIRGGKTTGPYLYVWSAGSSALAPLTRLVSGSLSGPDGLVATKVIDSSLLHGLAQAGNGWLLPISPLRAGATYHATITIAAGLGGRKITHSWTFTATPGSLVF